MTAWATHESLVRNDSVGHYGNIEMALASIRIAAARKPADTKEWKTALDQFDTAVQSFLDGEQVQAKKTGLQSLLTPLEEAQTALAASDLPQAKLALESFLKTWPRAEGEVRTRNEGLYSQLESDVPLLLARLTPETRQKTAQELQSFENAIAQLQTKTHYTFIDAMLVMLREGLEALLIVSALVAFARKSRTKQEGKVWAGAGLGLIASGLLALILQTVFQASFAATGREQIGRRHAVRRLLVALEKRRRETQTLFVDALNDVLVLRQFLDDLPGRCRDVVILHRNGTSDDEDCLVVRDWSCNRHHRTRLVCGHPDRCSFTDPSFVPSRILVNLSDGIQDSWYESARVAADKRLTDPSDQWTRNRRLDRLLSDDRDTHPASRPDDFDCDVYDLAKTTHSSNPDGCLIHFSISGFNYYVSGITSYQQLAA